MRPSSSPYLRKSEILLIEIFHVILAQEVTTIGKYDEEGEDKTGSSASVDTYLDTIGNKFELDHILSSGAMNNVTQEKCFSQGFFAL